MNLQKKLSLYIQLYHFFMSKEDKVYAVIKYAKKTAVRGGTFWAWFLWFMFINIEIYIITQEYYALTIFINQLYFIPLGVTYGLLRELYFDYESTT